MDSFFLGNLAALGAALCWALGPVIAVKPVNAMGSVNFGRLRFVCAFVILIFIAGVSGRLSLVETKWAGYIAVSSLLGVIIGEVALFQAIKMLGARRGSILYALNAPFTAILAWLFFAEVISGQTLIGASLMFTGVVFAILTKSGGSDVQLTGRLMWLGVGVGIASALCQAAGSIAIKPALIAGVDPVNASVYRVGFASLVSFLLAVAVKDLSAYRVSRELLGQTALSALVSTGLGATLMIVALSLTSAGLASILSSLSPVLILPIVYLFGQEKPRLLAWVGGILAYLGIVLVFWI